MVFSFSSFFLTTIVSHGFFYFIVMVFSFSSFFLTTNVSHGTLNLTLSLVSASVSI